MRRLVVAAVVAALSIPTAAQAAAPPEPGGRPHAPAAANADPVAAVVRTAGPSRIHTAIEVSRHAFPAGAPAVVLARADAFADALAGGPLAAALGGPVLLTPSGSLDPLVAEELRRLSPREVVLLGGDGALTAAVAEQVRELGIARVDRLAGSDRFATAAAIGDRLLAEVVPDTITVHVVEGAHADPGRGWPDAVSASALASAARSPILLVTSGGVPEPTRAALARWGPARATIVGGAAAVSDTVALAIDGLAGTVARHAGPDRYATSTAAADAAAARGGSAAAVWLASGSNWPDALVTGPAAAQEGGLLLLAPGNLPGSATGDWLGRHRDGLRTVRLVGGSAALPDAVASTVAPLLPAAGDFGRWSDPATWGGRVPRAGEDVTIPADRRVLLDIATPVLRTLTVHGELEFARQDGVALSADVVAVHGRLGVGDPGRPFRHPTTITLHPDPSGPNAKAHTGTGGLVAHDGTIDLFGNDRMASWTRLAATATASSDRLQVERAPGWRAGDRIAIAATGLDPTQAETATIAGIDGTSITLSKALAHTHYGAREQIAGDPRPVEQFAEVGLLTRTVKVVGPPDADRTGGHVMAMGDTPRLRVSGVEVTRMGQAGEVGRYPLHFHMLGDALGSFIRRTSIHGTFQRCVTIHGTSRVRLTDTVAHDAPGHCVFLEDGVETENVIADNLVLGTRVPAAADRLLDSDLRPASYWIQHPRNVLRGNHAAGGHGFGFWYDLPDHPTGLSATTDVANRTEAFGVFRDAVAHSYAHLDVDFHTGTGLFVEDYRPAARSVFRDVTAWKNEGFGIWLERGNLAVDGAVLAGNGTGFLGHGTDLTDALIVGTTGNDADRPWKVQGIGVYVDGGDVSDVTLANFKPHEWRHGYGIGSNTEHMRSFARFRDIRFLNADPVRLLAPWMDDDHVGVGFVDVDGSVLGAPGTAVSGSPILHGKGCAAKVAWAATVCPGEVAVAQLRIADETGGPDFADPTLRRSDGATSRLQPERRGGKPLLNALVRMGDHVTLQPGVSMAAITEVVLSSPLTGGVRVTVPWSHARAYVYDGWGEWAEHAQPATSAQAVNADRQYHFDADADRLTVWIDTAPTPSGDAEWERYLLCAVEYCGQGVGSRR